MVPEVRLKFDTVPGEVPAVTVALVPLMMLVPLNFTLKIRFVEASDVSVVK
jgi:hypothetical protein